MKKTQKEFLRDLSSKNKKVTMESAGYVLDALQDVLADYAKDGHEVVLPGLGKFYTVKYGERTHYNPHTLQTEIIPPATKLRFKASESLYKN